MTRRNDRPLSGLLWLMFLLMLFTLHGAWLKVLSINSNWRLAATSELAAAALLQISDNLLSTMLSGGVPYPYQVIGPACHPAEEFDLLTEVLFFRLSIDGKYTRRFAVLRWPPQVWPVYPKQTSLHMQQN